MDGWEDHLYNKLINKQCSKLLFGQRSVMATPMKRQYTCAVLLCAMYQGRKRDSQKTAEDEVS